MLDKRLGNPEMPLTDSETYDDAGSVGAVRPPFRAVDREAGSILESIIAQVCRALESGVYSPGDVLPGERDLAAQFLVSRNTLREALSTLSLLGVLEVRHGSRTRIAPDGGGALARAFDFLIQLDRPDFLQIQRARESLEVQLAGEAALRATDRDIAEVGAALQYLFDVSAEVPFDRVSVRSANYLYHQAVAKAAHNPVLERVLVQLHRARQALVIAGPVARPNRPETNEIHERIFYAIRDHDYDGARRAMTMDMRIAMRVLQKLYARPDSGHTAEKADSNGVRPLGIPDHR